MGVVAKIVGAGVGIAVVVGAIWLLKERKKELAETPPPKIYPVRVHLEKFNPREVTTTLPAIGEVKSSQEVKLASKYSGKLLMVKPLGSKVKAGEEIARIENSQLHAKLAEVESNIASTRKMIASDRINLQNLLATHRRTKELLKAHMASVEEYQNETTKIAQLRAKIASEEEKLKALASSKSSIISDLGYTKLVSPVDGVISGKFFNRGDVVFPGKPIVQITPSTGSYLLLLLPTPPKGVIYKGKYYPALSLNRTINGLGAYRVNLPDQFSPGERVKVRVVTFKGQGVLLPDTGYLAIDGKSYIFLWKNGKPVKEPIKIVARGVEGVVIDKTPPAPVVVAEPDILLKIGGGYPAKPIEPVKVAVAGTNSHSQGGKGE
ncbi:MAG: hypothetical protein C6I01_02605 [Epsilonproteobacteria bacterium]|jgi:biotin carboxyl carrier protein|nr:hypothetical protein [Campylobacterota bacterium]NPA88905.1 hypothetical protein [Campylobacterota bacterium]